jgi:hypothetical protein
MFGRVNVRYYSAPAKLMYCVELATGVPSADNLECMSTGVLQGLQALVLARSKMSRVYYR